MNENVYVLFTFTEEKGQYDVMREKHFEYTDMLLCNKIYTVTWKDKKQYKAEVLFKGTKLLCQQKLKMMTSLYSGEEDSPVKEAPATKQKRALQTTKTKSSAPQPSTTQPNSTQPSSIQPSSIQPSSIKISSIHNHKYKELQEKYTELQDKYTELQDRHQNLEEKYNSLEDKYQESEKQLKDREHVIRSMKETERDNNQQMDEFEALKIRHEKLKLLGE